MHCISHHDYPTGPPVHVIDPSLYQTRSGVIVTPRFDHYLLLGTPICASAPPPTSAPGPSCLMLSASLLPLCMPVACLPCPSRCFHGIHSDRETILSLILTLHSSSGLLCQFRSRYLIPLFVERPATELLDQVLLDADVASFLP